MGVRSVESLAPSAYLASTRVTLSLQSTLLLMLESDPDKHCIVFIHFYSAFHNMSLSDALPTTAIDTVGVYTKSTGRSLSSSAQDPCLNPLAPTRRGRAHGTSRGTSTAAPPDK